MLYRQYIKEIKRSIPGKNKPQTEIETPSRKVDVASPSWYSGNIVFAAFSLAPLLLSLLVSELTLALVLLFDFLPLSHALSIPSHIGSFLLTLNCLATLCLPCNLYFSCFLLMSVSGLFILCFCLTYLLLSVSCFLLVSGLCFFLHCFFLLLIGIPSMSQLELNTTLLLLSLFCFVLVMVCCLTVLLQIEISATLSLNYLLFQCITSHFCLWGCLLPPSYNSMQLICHSLLLPCCIGKLTSSFNSEWCICCSLYLTNYIVAFLLFSCSCCYQLQCIWQLQSLLCIMLLLHLLLLTIHAKFARSLCKSLCILVVRIIPFIAYSSIQLKR